MAVGMRAEHLLHPIAGAKSQIACGVKFSVSAAQDFSRPFVTVVTFRHRKPVEEKPCQRQTMPLRSLSSDVTQPTFCKSKDYVRFELLHRFFQRFIGCHRPDKIFVVRDPRSQSRTESALSQSMNQIRQSQSGMHQETVLKVCVAGHVQFEWISLNQMPVHDDAYTAIVPWRNNAYEQHRHFFHLTSPSQPEAAGRDAGLVRGKRLREQVR